MVRDNEVQTYTKCEDAHRIIYNCNDHSIIATLTEPTQYWNGDKIVKYSTLTHMDQVPALLRDKDQNIYFFVPYQRPLLLYNQKK